MKTFRALVAAAILTFSAGNQVHAIITGQATCEAGKNQASGKYALCLQSARAQLVKAKGTCSASVATACYRDDECPSGESCQKDLTRYNERVVRCEGKFAARWDLLEQRASDKGALCPDGSLQAEFKGEIDEHASNIAAGLEGDGLVHCSADLTMCSTALDQCVGTDLPACAADLGTCSASLSQCVNVDLPACDAGLTTCSSSLAVCGADLAVCDANLATAEACGNGVIDAGEDCDLIDLNDGTCASESFAGGVLRCGPNCVYDTAGCYSSRFIDNADGTVSDRKTGLMWEKKANYDGVVDVCSSSPACPDPHDADNSYAWTNNDFEATGPAYFVFLDQLNRGCDGAPSTLCATDSMCAGIGSGRCGFAGHNDWRLPTLEELRGIFDYEDPTPPGVDAAFDTACDGSCTVATCSCTATVSAYWTSSTSDAAFDQAWAMLFGAGAFAHVQKDSPFYARAVRTERFRDNGDGTISDQKTGLMWERKADADFDDVLCASAALCPDPHDNDNKYSWSASSPNADGTAFTVFLQQLNAACDGDSGTSCTLDGECSGIGSGFCGFAGHQDWRLPTLEEFLSIYNYSATDGPEVAGAFSAPCADSCSPLTCSCNIPDTYWTSSTSAQDNDGAWTVTYFGLVQSAPKSGEARVRAVRGGG